MNASYDSLLLMNLSDITVDDIEIGGFIINFSVETLHDSANICELQVDVDLEKLYTGEVTPSDFILDFVRHIISLIPKDHIVEKKNDSFYLDQDVDFRSISLFLSPGFENWKLIIPPIYINTNSNWLNLLNKVVLIESNKTINT